MASTFGDSQSILLSRHILSQPSSVLLMTSSQQTVQFMIPWMSMVLWTQIGQLARGHIAPSRVSAFAWQAAPLHTKRNYSLQLHNHLLRLNSWVHPILAKSSCTSEVCYGTLEYPNMRRLSFTRIPMHARLWQWRKNQPHALHIWILSTWLSASQTGSTTP